MAAKFVMPYRKSGTNEGNDAQAICDAVARPNMRSVPVKSLEQQSDLTLHRVRPAFVEERSATLNRLRGLLAESGHVLPLPAGRKGESDAALATAIRKNGASWPSEIARVYAFRGETDRAFEWLDRAMNSEMKICIS